MTNDAKEQLSALIDSELSSASAVQIISRMEESPDLRDTWDRYSLIGDTIRGEGIRGSAAGVAESVRGRLLAEPAIIANPIPVVKSRTGDRILRPLAGAALAASVAAVAVFTLPRLDGELSAPVPVQVVSEPTQPAARVIQTGTRWKNLAEPALESKLNRYLENHSEYASSGGMGVVPYSSFVSYDTTHSRP